MHVLVVERETTFKDRVRGEWIAPWGVAEAQKLGLYEPLVEHCAHVTPCWNDVMQPLRDFRTTTPQCLPTLTLYHPAMQETVLGSARNAGAEVWRGATVSGLRVGDPAGVFVERDGRVIELIARLVVCADGRNSAARSWAGFATNAARRSCWAQACCSKIYRSQKTPVTSCSILSMCAGRW